MKKKNCTGKRNPDRQEFKTGEKTNDRMKITRHKVELHATIELFPSTNRSFGNFVDRNS